MIKCKEHLPDVVMVKLEMVAVMGSVQHELLHPHLDYLVVVVVVAVDVEMREVKDVQVQVTDYQAMVYLVQDTEK